MCIDNLDIKLESYTDYPKSARNNAQRALDWAEKNGWGSCGTPVGKIRANQLANGEPISVDTIQRMYSYLSRHEVDLQTSKSYSDGCGKLMYDSWGGLSAKSWAESKIKELELGTQSVTDNTWSTEAPINVNFKSQRKVIFNEDFDDASVISYIEKGFKVHIRSSRKIHKRDKKVWNKLRSVGLTEDQMVFGEVKDLDKRYEYDLLMTGQDPILEKLKLMGEDGSKYKVLSSKIYFL